jgi:hypothetical protein
MFSILGFKNLFWDWKTIKSNVITKVKGVSGSLMLFDKNVINKIGYFDEKFFLYLEDLDFCRRARSKNIPIFYNPHAFGIHMGGGSSINSKNKIVEKAWNESKVYFCKKVLLNEAT